MKTRSKAVEHARGWVATKTGLFDMAAVVADVWRGQWRGRMTMMSNAVTGNPRGVWGVYRHK